MTRLDDIRATLAKGPTPGWAGAHEWNVYDDLAHLLAEVERLTGEAAAERARIGAILVAEGCDCACGHDYQDHDGDCIRCLGCRVEAALSPEAPAAPVASEGAAYRWTEAPWGSYPVQGHLELADGSIGYYRSRGGNTTVELWPAGTTWPESGDLPAEDGDERDLSAYVVVGSRPEDDETTADGIVARWLAAGAPRIAQGGTHGAQLLDTP